MDAADDKESDKLVRDYLSKNRILIIDSVSSARVSLAVVLNKFGAQRNMMSLVGSLAEAREDIKINKPKVIFSDFMVGNESSLDLLQYLKAEFDKEKIKDNLFVLVTANGSQSTVARAAEEDVDTFVIKPYSTDTLRRALTTTVQQKLFPSLYMQLVNEGKELLFASQYDKAIELFAKAMNENPHPTLACFYYGQAEYMKKAFAVAEGKYMDGLSHNKIHYKCLIGLFELLYQEKKYTDAYEVIKKLAQYFPANPKRLASVLRLAIMTDNYQDMEGYYRIFVKIDERSDELIRYMCSALVVTGKYYLRQKIRSRGVEVFENAAISAGGRVGFLLYIVEALVDQKMLAECDQFISRLQSLAPASKEFQAASFLVMSLKEQVKEAIHVGRTLLKDGIEFPSVYEKLIIQSIKGGYRDAAMDLAKIASQKWPDKRQTFLYGFDPNELKGTELAS